MTRFQSNGAALITEKIQEAQARGLSSVTITGNYEMESTVLLPSGMTLILEDCHLRMADGTFCNMFTNENCRTERGRYADGADRDIVIEGRGRAILDGGEYNGLSERNSRKDGRPHISVNNLILFANVDGFRVSGLHLRNQRWWAMNFLFCRNGVLRDLDFLSDHTSLDAQGNRVEGLHLGYQAIYIKNSDGIDLRAGCHDILIENITGFTEDDSVALTGLHWELEKDYFPTHDLPTDIHDITVRNIRTSALCANVRLLNQSGVKLYNILVEDVFDASETCPYVDRGICTVRIGDNELYGTRHSTAQETCNITLRNITSRGGWAAVMLAGSIHDLKLENIRRTDDCAPLIQNDAVLS